MRTCVRVSLLVLLLLPGRMLFADTIVSNMSSWSGTTFSVPVGTDPWTSLGQTFTVPTDNHLDSFALVCYDNSADLNPFRADLYAWDGLSASGPCLWESAATALAAPLAAETITFHPDVDLTTGTQYVFFVTNLRDSAGLQSVRIAGCPTDTYGDGYVVGGTDTDPAHWTAPGYWEAQTDKDVAFTATFTDGSGGAVPEPGTWALLAVGLVGFVGLRRKLGKA